MKWSPRVVMPAAVAISVLLVAISLFWRVDSRRAAVPPAAETPQQAASPETPALSRNPATPAQEGNQREVTLFFQSAKEDDLVPETRKIFLTSSVTDQARQVVRELIDGPHSALLPTIPATAELREIYLAPGGIAYVDFSKAFVDAHPGGSSAEISTIFSLVDTLAYNFPEIKSVRFLVEGEERATLKEHLDLGRAYVADMSMVSRTEGTEGTEGR